jgi:hypothetical protein
MMRRAIGLLIAAVGMCGCASTSQISTVQFPLTCTNQNGVTRIWHSMQEGDASEGNVKTVAGPNGTMISSASTTGTVDKLATPPAVDLRQIVWGSIANGMDPVDAARMFGPWTIEDQVHATRMAGPVTADPSSCFARAAARRRDYRPRAAPPVFASSQ